MKINIYVLTLAALFNLQTHAASNAAVFEVRGKSDTIALWASIGTIGAAASLYSFDKIWKGWKTLHCLHPHSSNFPLAKAGLIAAATSAGACYQFDRLSKASSFSLRSSVSGSTASSASKSHWQLCWAVPMAAYCFYKSYNNHTQSHNTDQSDSEDQSVSRAKIRRIRPSLSKTLLWGVAGTAITAAAGYAYLKN